MKWVRDVLLPLVMTAVAGIFGMASGVGPDAFADANAVREAFRKKRAAMDEYYVASKKIREEKGKVSKEDRKRLMERIVYPRHQEYNNAVKAHRDSAWDRLAKSSPGGTSTNRSVQGVSGSAPDSGGKDPRKEPGETIDGSDLPAEIEFRRKPKRRMKH